MLQELAAKSAELAEQEQVLQDRELAMHSQVQELEAKQKQLMHSKAEVSSQRDTGLLLSQLISVTIILARRDVKKSCQNMGICLQ